MINLVVTRSIKHGGLIDDEEALTPEEKELITRAGNAIQEYRLISSGAATWFDLGYGVRPPMVKLMEYLAIDSDMKEALQEIQKHGN